MKIALVFDPITQRGGAEQLLWSLADKYQTARIFTSVANFDLIPERFVSRIETSWLQKFPLSYVNPKPYLLLLPLSYESFDFTSFDVVISITTLFAKSVVTNTNTLHIGYINSPPRFLYNQENLSRYISNNLFRKPILDLPFSLLKKYDFISARRPDILISNSQNISQKVKNIYKLDSKVIYPFASNYYFNRTTAPTLKNKNQFVLISRLEKWKRIDYVIHAFSTQLGNEMKLIIIGSGSDKRRLEKLSGRNVSFTGYIPRSKVAQIIASSQAMIMPQEEDFGIVSVESQALGTPVIAYNRGGATETVIDSVTGVLFENQSANSLIKAINRMQTLSFKADKLRQNALKYQESAFLENFEKIIKS